jgi:hypothetical protein
MAAEDVPVAEVDQRLTGWAAMSAPDQYQQRVATMLNITPRADSGQPQGLALANFPSEAVMVAEAAAQAPVEMPVQVAAKAPAPSPAPVAASAPRPAPSSAPAAAPSSPGTFAQAFDAPTYSSKPRTAGAATSSSAPRYVSNPVVQQLPAQAQRPAPVAAPRATPAPAARTASSDAASDKAANSHLVQLGSYGSKAEATRGWAALSAKFPQLKDHDVVITEALVNGRSFWRVAAAGFGPKSAKSLCGTVKSAGRGCFAYAATNPPAGAVDRGVRMAARTR